MNFTLIILFAILFIAIPGIISYSFRNETKIMMKRINPKYTGHVNNSFDFFRIIRAYINPQGLSKKEKATLRLSIVLISISWIAGLIFFISIIFFTDQILN